MSNLKLFVNGYEIALLIEKFPAGESLVRIVGGYRVTSPISVGIEMNFKGNGDIIDLLLLTDAVRRRWPNPGTTIDLSMKYMPYARQDRVCNTGESLSVKVIADIINAQGYSRVLCLDLHSDVSAALINNLSHIDISGGIGLVLRQLHPDAVLVSPDAGANKKVLKFAKVRGFKTVVRADKERDVATGEILGTAVYSGHIGERDFLIIDDICDGGRTFIELAKALRPLTAGKIYLYVSHGIFSKGAEVFEGLIDGIYTANLMGEKHPLITEI